MLPHQVKVSDNVKNYGIDIKSVFKIAQILGPPVLLALEFDIFTLFEIMDLIQIIFLKLDCI